MKLSSLVLEGFRGFANRAEIDLSADTTVLTGPNGQGKTSILDGVLWGLTGVLSRLGEETSSVVSLYSQTGEASVQLKLVGDEGELTIRRATDGRDERLFVEGSGDSLSGRAAQLALAERFGVGVDFGSERQALGLAELHTAMTRAVYLQQDLVREFLEAEDEGARYASLGRLFGSGKINQLQVELAKQKAAWTGASTPLREEQKELEGKLRRLQVEIEQRSPSQARYAVSAEAWREWWAAVSNLGIVTVETPDMEGGEASIALDRAIREIEVRRRQSERRRQRLEDLGQRASVMRISDVEPQQGEGLNELEAAMVEAEELLGERKERLAEAEADAEGQRLQALKVRGENKERAIFATLALRYLDERCPVCEQSYDIEGARTRLSSIVAGADAVFTLPDTESLDNIRRQVQEEMAAVAAAKKTLADARAREHERASLISLFREEELTQIAESPPSTWADLLKVELASVAQHGEQLHELREEGENLSLGVARAGEIARLEALRDEQEALKKRVQDANEAVQARDETGRLAQGIIEGLREAGQLITSRELKRIAPLAQRIYSTLDPHPSFRMIELEATMFKGRGRISASVRDDEQEVETDKPERVLSSSQSNALALSVFIALNLGTGTLPVRALMLDDPLQSLDDINLLGLIDLLRRLAVRRQLIISTHDARFAGLLERKLRPINGQMRTRFIHVKSWRRGGPAVTTREVEQRQMYVVA